MEDFVTKIAGMTGLSTINAAVLFGIVAGFILAKIFSRRAPGAPSFPDHAKSRAAVQSLLGSISTHDGPSITVNQSNLTIEPALSMQLIELLKQKKKLEAIKLLRQEKDLDLVQAKNLVEILETQVR